MNAVEKALRHIEKLQQRLIKALPPQTKRQNYKSRPKSAAKLKKSRRNRAKLKVDTQPFVPPVTQPDVSELEQTFAPPPTPPEVEGPISPAFPVLDVADVVTPLGAGLVADRTGPSRPAWADAWEAAHPSGTPPEAAKVAPAPAQATGRGSCKAIDAKTGLVCKLGAHAGDEHGHERGRFHLVAAPGQQVRRAVDDVAWGTHVEASP